MKINGTFIISAAVLAFLLAGCASRSPAPVVGRDGQSLPVQASSGPRDTYTVKSGDTLYSIAREHGMDHRELIAMNAIETPNHISVGRVLKVKPQGVANAAPVSATAVVAQPISAGPVVETRPLVTSSDTDSLKREPKAGKVPYSDQALVQAQSTTPRQDAAKGPDMPVTARPEAKPAETPVAAAVTEAPPWIWPANGKVIGNFGENGNKGVDVSGKMGDPVVAVEEGKVILANNTLRGYGNMVVIKHSNTLISVYAHNSKMLVKEGQNVAKGQKIAEMGNTDTDQVKLHFEVRLQGKPVDPLKYLPQR